MNIKRYDSIEYNYSGGFSWSPDGIKECEDGELVKYDDIKAAFQTIKDRLEDSISDAYNDCNDSLAHQQEITLTWLSAVADELTD